MKLKQSQKICVSFPSKGRWISLITTVKKYPWILDCKSVEAVESALKHIEAEGINGINFTTASNVEIQVSLI